MTLSSTHPCGKGHDYDVLKSSYYKQTGSIGGLGLPTYDQNVSYAMLYCRRCGETKEVMAADHRKEEKT